MKVTKIGTNMMAIIFVQGITYHWYRARNKYFLFVLLQEDFWGRVSGWGCSIANISTGAHTNPKLNKHNAKWYTGILIYIVGYQFHETVNSEIKKITIDNFQ